MESNVSACPSSIPGFSEICYTIRSVPGTVIQDTERILSVDPNRMAYFIDIQDCATTVPRPYQDLDVWAANDVHLPRSVPNFVIQDAEPILSVDQDRMAYFTHIQDCPTTV